MSNLPPEDQPPDPLFAPSSPEEVIEGMGELTLENPMTAALAVYRSVLTGDIEEAKMWVTPESLDAWEDFSAAREMFEELGLASNAEQPSSGEPDVRYAKLIRGVKQTSVVTQDTVLLIPAVMNMVYRPEIGHWVVHSIGDYQLPEVLPRTA